MALANLHYINALNNNNNNTAVPRLTQPLLHGIMIVGFHAEYYIILHSDSIDHGQAIFEPPPEKLKRPVGWLHTTWMKNIHDDLPSLDLVIYEARDLVQNWPLLMSLHSAMHVW